jgi:hypothetical protein
MLSILAKMSHTTAGNSSNHADNKASGEGAILSSHAKMPCTSARIGESNADD